MKATNLNQKDFFMQILIKYELIPKTCTLIQYKCMQEGSRTISQNVTWGKRVSFQEGKVSFAYRSFLGYKKENDKPVIDEDEAVIVMMIYRMFLVEGKTPSGIASYLTSLHIKRPMGKSTKWTQNTIDSIHEC